MKKPELVHYKIWGSMLGMITDEKIFLCTKEDELYLLSAYSTGAQTQPTPQSVRRLISTLE